MANSLVTYVSRKKSPGPPMAELRFKLAGIIYHHQKMKLSFHQLKSQIQVGLSEAECVFASLAVPLMKLVGLKTGEMAEEGRFSTVIIDKDMSSEPLRGRDGFQPECIRRGFGLETPVESSYASNGRYEEGGYVCKATLAGKELIQKQRLQITELIRLLKQIETQVNSSHNDILQTLSDHRASMHRFFQRTMAYLAAIHSAGMGHNHDILFITVKLLQATFEHVNEAFGSVEGGVEDLIHNLAEQMCTPMMDYVKSLKAEIMTGTFLHLLTIVEKMGDEMRNRQLELEQERRKVRVAEERKIEALSMLKKSEESIQKLKEYMGSLIETRRECMEYFAPPKLKGVEEDQAKDERLLWEFVNKKEKYQKPDSPLGPQELNCIGFNNNNYKSTRKRPQITNRSITRTYVRGITSKTPCLDSFLVLGSSPSVSTQKVLSRRRITP